MYQHVPWTRFWSLCLMALLHNKPWEGTNRWNRLAAKAYLHSMYSKQIQTSHEQFSYCRSSIHNGTSSYVQGKWILNYQKEFTDWFDITVVIPGPWPYHCFNPLNSRKITTAFTFLSTSLTTCQITENLKSNIMGILVSQNDFDTFTCFLHVAGSLVVIHEEWQDLMFYLKFMQPCRPYFNFFWPQREDCSRIQNNNIQFVICVSNAKICETCKMLPELLSQTEKKHRSRHSSCSY